jgi:hypothetical protein
MDDIRQNFAQQGFIRPQEGRVLGGVIAGLGRRFGIEARWPPCWRRSADLARLVLAGSHGS